MTVPNFKPPRTFKQQFPALTGKSNAATGVIYCTERATAKGYVPNSNSAETGWANLGQGMPETGDIPGCFERPTTLPISVDSREYGPPAGIKALRQKIADLYNEHYRQGKESKYTWENVNISPGGRAALTRVASILDDAYLSFFLPDYTAYAEMLSLFKNFAPIPTPLYQGQEDFNAIVAGELKRGVSAILTSNPRNPTGECLSNETLEELHSMCRENCLLIMDEFYSRYYYDGELGESISSAAFVDDVNKDPVLIIDGLTKSFRLPGWRVSWIIGPKEYIEALNSSGSFLDGGANYPFQEAAIKMLEPELVHKETVALQTHFKAKRDYCIERLTKMGFKFDRVPNSTFYIWLDLSTLNGNITEGLKFFEYCLDEKCILVPGIFFDLNPLSYRELEHSVMLGYVRLSYGPPLEELKIGLDAIERVINKYN